MLKWRKFRNTCLVLIETRNSKSVPCKRYRPSNIKNRNVLVLETIIFSRKSGDSETV